MGDLGASRIVAPALAITAPPPGAGIVLAATGTAATGSGGTISIPYTAGISAGDCLLAYVITTANPATTPGGWTVVGQQVDGTATRNVKLILKIADGSESGSLVVTTPSTSEGRMRRYTGVNQTTPEDVTAVKGTATATNPSVTVTAVTTVTDGALSVVAAGARYSGDIALTGGWAEGDDTGLSAFYDKSMATAGSTGTGTLTGASGASASINYVHGALRPA